MKSEPYQDADGHSIHGDDPEMTYSVDVIAELIGVSTKTVLHYQELGVVTPIRESDQFDTECLRQLSRLEHLRHQHELTDGAVRLIAGLLSEIEQLRDERRRRLRFDHRDHQK